MKRHLLLPILTFFAFIQLNAQSASEVLRYAYLQPGGTARYIGAGGAFGALGADFGALSQNPAGLAQFRSDEFTLTPSLRFANTDANLNGAVLNDTRSAFGFDNLGIVFNTQPYKSKWKTFNVGIGMNRQSSYNLSGFYQGNASGSLMTGYFNQAQSEFAKGGNEDNLDPFGARLAWDANAFYYECDTCSGLSYDFAGAEQAVIKHEQTLINSGRFTEMVFSIAGNYDEKLMVGATLGVPWISYTQETEYREKDETGAVPFFDDLTATEKLKTEGFGINLKLGVQYKVTQALRLGVAVHTPTRLGLTDRYSNTLAYSYTIPGDAAVVGDPQSSPEGTSDYRLITPWRAIGSAAVVIKKYGFLSADVELVDYGASAYNFTADVASTENEAAERATNSEIGRLYKQAVNIRLGGEAAISKFRLRAGVNMLEKPGASDSGYNISYSAGAGVRHNAYYLDLGWRRYTGSGSIQKYSGGPIASTENAYSELLLTLGMKF